MAVVEAGSFTRGARSLGITQPSLSQHIRSPTAGAFVEVLREARQPAAARRGLDPPVDPDTPAGVGRMVAVPRLFPLALLALALSACGGGSSAPPVSSPGDVSAARVRTVAAGPAYFTIAIAAKVAGASVRSSETGTISFKRRAAHLYKILPGGALPQELILDGPYTYANANVDAALHDPSVRPWTKLDTRRLSAAQRSSRPDELEHVRSIVYLVDGVRQARRIGDATVEGARTTHYRGRVDPRRVVARTPAAERAGVRTAIRNDFLDKPFPADFWLDDKGRVRRVVVRYRTAGGGRIALDATYSRFGDKVDLALPPARSIQDISP